MSKAFDTFSAFEENAEKALEAIRRNAFNPAAQKTLRTWGIVDAAKMIDRTPQLLRDAEKEGRIPSPTLDPDTGRKIYTLEDINKLRDYFGTRPKKPSGANPCILAVANFKGGVWKSTEANDLALNLAFSGYRVLLIDGDSQGSLTQSAGYIPDSDIDQDETLLPCMIETENATLATQKRPTYCPGLDIIPANLMLYQSEFFVPITKTLADRENKDYLIYDKISNAITKEIEEYYDFIIIDCPPSMGIISTNALYAANALLIPLPPSMYDFSSTKQFFTMVKTVLNSIPEKEYDFIRMLITKYDRSDNSNMHVTLFRQLFGDHVLQSMIPASEAAKKASAEMRSIYEIEKYSGSHKTLERIKEATDEFADEIKNLAIKAWQKQITGGNNNG